jgi:hypothetical protein
LQRCQLLAISTLIATAAIQRWRAQCRHSESIALSTGLTSVGPLFAQKRTERLAERDDVPICAFGRIFFYFPCV